MLEFDNRGKPNGTASRTPRNEPASRFSRCVMGFATGRWIRTHNSV